MKFSVVLTGNYSREFYDYMVVCFEERFDSSYDEERFAYRLEIRPRDGSEKLDP